MGAKELNELTLNLSFTFPISETKIKTERSSNFSGPWAPQNIRYVLTNVFSEKQSMIMKSHLCVTLT